MSSERFASTVDIWISKPHVVNRKIFGATLSRAPDGVHWNRIVIPRSQKNFPNFSEQIVQSESQFHFTSDYLSYIVQLDDVYGRKLAMHPFISLTSDVVTDYWCIFYSVKEYVSSPAFFILQFNGVGVDCRARAIWNIYPTFVRQHLTETTLNVECCAGFPNATWLIGNHSDELTPWLPILAARSGPSCRVFVLPCCPFGLYGKYNNFLHNTTEMDNHSDSNTSADEQSRYRLYLAYLRGLFHVCELSSEIDMLRIPSTKRICLVGRNVLQTDQTLRLSKIADAVAREKQVATVPFFVARSNHEPILNCTRVPGDIKHAVCDMIFAKLLEMEPDLKQLKSKDLFVSPTGCIKTVDGRWWNPGGQLALNQVAVVLEREQLESMKSQHGGLQTLLRNHHQAFRGKLLQNLIVQGFVQIRWLPEKMAKVSNVVDDLSTKGRSSKQSVEFNKRKIKPCWLLQHHPDGCPYPSKDCDFLHD
ncbi:tRNASer (uridine44-2'-O)-methyltransferase [Paragonimus westermani]|uniref:tRNA (uracil-O(2)-)-methyltransferase n=1 Tax=Paragonimus westermani TaxID=34504 RepID=A0A5J4NRT4_9TREM|nr:tRNASer (uridine44-2'-O)-methyltransferase [Paragonimus westermani]